MTTYHILITDDLSPQALERLEAAGDADFEVARRPSPEELREIIQSYDAIIIRSSVRMDADLLAVASQLKVIGRAGMGLDNVDIDAASLRGVIVMNTPGANTVATAEHAVAMLLALCRHVPQADVSMRGSEWTRSQFSGVQLCRKTLGIVGLGWIGAQVARRNQAFDMRIIDSQPEGNVLVTESIEVPGVIGRVGTLLGACSINIAEWRLGRIAPGGEALAFINLDSPAPQDVLVELVRLGGVNRVRQVAF